MSTRVTEALPVPTSPGMALNAVQELCLGPRVATVSAHRDLSDLGLARPCSAENRVHLVRCKRFVNPWSRDLGLHVHFSQRAPHGLSIQMIPIGVVRCLPVPLKRIAHSVDIRQPLDGSHSIMAGDDGAHRISMILRKFTPIHLVGDQYFLLQRFVPGQTAGIRDRTGR